MHPADITAALRKAGSSQAAIAVRLRLTRQAVCHVVNGHRRSPQIRRAISRTTGIPVHQLWPPT